MSQTLIPEPGVIPDVLPDTFSDSAIAEMIESAQEDFYIGVMFDPRGKIYVYLGTAGVHVGSVVLVPGSWYCPEPQAVDVVTLSPPPPPPGVAIKRVIAVLS